VSEVGDLDRVGFISSYDRKIRDIVVSEVGCSDRIGFISSGYDSKYVTIWYQYSCSHKLVPVENCRSYIAVDKSEFGSHTTKMVQTRQQIMEMLAVRLALIDRRELEEADAYYIKLEPLWARLPEERKADHDKMMTKLKDKMDAEKEIDGIVFYLGLKY
jgi:hypothetical protein